MPSVPVSERQLQIWIIPVVLLVICMVGVWRPLWTPDEPREAEISREMSIAPSPVPILNGRQFLEKPPLYYWVVALVFNLAGEATAALARSVSALSGYLTVLLVFFWGRRRFSMSVAAVAALGLATSFRFAVSTHWILIDPFLMLLSTIAVLSAWDLLQSGRARTAIVLYGALALALWAKGLIGPVLVSAGVGTYCLVSRRTVEWRRLRLPIGLGTGVLAVALLVFAIYAYSGMSGLREWFWINHVMRLVDPQGTGHERPITYYFWALPTAVLPWWVGALETLRPSSWRNGATSIQRYLGLVVCGMFIVLSLAATKREIYLLPLLPPLFLLLASHVVSEWHRGSVQLVCSVKWWIQLALCSLLAAGPVTAVVIYLDSPDASALWFLAACLLLVAGTTILTLSRRRYLALGGLAGCAVAGIVGLLVIVPILLNPHKDMGPFLEQANSYLPPGEPMTVAGHVDETLEGLVPFTTGREMREIPLAEVGGELPRYVLVQSVEGQQLGSRLPDAYELVFADVFGDERELALWRLAPD